MWQAVLRGSVSNDAAMSQELVNQSGVHRAQPYAGEGGTPGLHCETHWLLEGATLVVL